MSVGPHPDGVTVPDRRDGSVYVDTPDIRLAVDVALATGRPLLLRGEPGSGKSSLAAHVALKRRWRYYEHVVTARTEARDLLWSFDPVRRLTQAEARDRSGSGEIDDADYVEPGVLWWAMAPNSARRRGAERRPRTPAQEPNAAINAGRSADHAVVLIDEIDKADPDVPNGLLVPLGSNEFVVTETRTLIREEPPTSDTGRGQHLIIITTNEERELPQAFLRRCVVIWLAHPDKTRLDQIAREHMSHSGQKLTTKDEQLIQDLADELEKARDGAVQTGLRRPSTAEYLDALHACRALRITPKSAKWAQLRDLTLIKPTQPGRAG